MPRNKPRIQLALYARPRYPGTYHYALYIAPKSNKGPVTKHHVKNTLLVGDGVGVSQPWRYEQLTLPDVNVELGLLVRVTVAKVTKSHDYVEQLLQSMPIYQVDDPDQAKADAFNCRTWVKEAYHKLESDGAVAAGSVQWEDLEKQAVEWIDHEREQGRWRTGWKGPPGVPLLNFLNG